MNLEVKKVILDVDEIFGDDLLLLFRGEILELGLAARETELKKKRKE